MLLTKAIVSSFRTIATPQEIDIDPRITVLIGANESGKTNLLQAMQCFSLENDLKPEDISKCKRRMYARKELPTIGFAFSLSKEDNERFLNLIPDLSGESALTVQKRGNGIGGYEVVIPKESVAKKLQEDEKRLANLLKEIGAEEEGLRKAVNRQKSKIGSINKELGKPDASPKRIKQLTTKKLRYTKELEAAEKRLTEKQDAKTISTKTLEKVQAQMRKSKDQTLKIGESKMASLIGLLPQVLYFRSLELIPESIPISEITSQTSPRSIVAGNLLKVGEIDDLSILNESPRRLKPILRGTASLISDRFTQAWKQEPLELELTKEGGNLIISLSERIAVSSPPQERSEGFQWFLSFFASFMLEPDEKTHSKIILLDEPAIRLHPRGQKDFLDMLERISENYQVIYTSHSPFLINRNFPQRIRILSKDTGKGTLINNKPYSDGKTRFWEPLKSAIGVCLGDVFSLGETNLVVEGISDQILITGISNRLAEIGAPFLDLEKTTIVPAMGALCATYLGKFAISEGLKAIVLLDNDSEGKKVFSKLKSESGLTIRSVDQLKKGAITIEDLIPRDRYIDAANSFYSKIKIADYAEYDEPKEKTDVYGIIEELDRHFEAIGYSLNKVSVAKELIEHLEIKEKDLSEYEAFIKLFEMASKN